MKKEKTAQAPAPGEVTGEQMAEINRYTRRKLAPEEVFVFSVILCDNEVDRDLEQFPAESLEKLAELFLGKTGLFDHEARTGNQSARIFHTQVVKNGSRNSLGEEYLALKAWAYILRCDKNRDLILEIDGGIKKEVSVGCAVEQARCSVCGKESGGCGHKKGKRYEGKVCHHLLVNPTDAYEWSFVAVPAQKNAGVTKARKIISEGGARMNLEKWLEQPAGEDLTVTREEHEGLAKEYASLKALARAGQEYLGDLRRQVVRLALLSQKELEPEVMEAVAGKMDVGELKAFLKAFAKTAETHYPIHPQTAGPVPEEEKRDVAQFKI